MPPSHRNDFNHGRPARDDAARFARDLTLAGRSERTVQAYTCYVRQVQRYHNDQPASLLNEEQVADWLASLRTERNFKAGSLRVAFSAMKAFYSLTCPVDWSVLQRLHTPREMHLPEVLTRQELHGLMNRIRRDEYYVCLWTIYSLGLRLSEGVALETGDIHAERGVVHVHRGKGNRDRLVALPIDTLRMLREYWATHRHPRFLFPAGGRGTPGQRHASASTHVPHTTIQDVWRLVVTQSGTMRKICVHTLRHSYATHLLEAGVPIRVVQQYLGHTSLQHTVKYLHLTQPCQDRSQEIVNDIMQRPRPLQESRHDDSG